MNSRVKYPRTPHLPWSSGATSDDVRHTGVSHFAGLNVVVTEKMDGENTSLYSDHIHARSLDSRHHPSRDWVKQWHAKFAHNIPEGWRICGENLFARHSIAYEKLDSYFYGFSIWNADNVCLSWDETLEWFTLLKVRCVPIIYQGLWNESLISGLRLDTAKQEGYVVRVADSFAYENFAQSVSKWVRADHVTTEKHWMHSEVIPNGLKSYDDE